MKNTNNYPRGGGKEIYVDPRHIEHSVNLPFWRDNNKLWALDVPVEEMSVSDFVWMFEVPFWEDDLGNIVVTPQEVMDNMNAYPTHCNRILNANITFPIDIMQNKQGKWVTLDGLHRLVKLAMNGIEQVRVRKIPPEMVHFTARN